MRVLKISAILSGALEFRADVMAALRHAGTCPFAGLDRKSPILGQSDAKWTRCGH